MTNSESDDVLLSALLDEELSAEDAARLEQRIAREPQLRARLDALARTDKAVRDRYASVADEPLPQSLRELLDANAPRPTTSCPWCGRRVRRRSPCPRPWLRAWRSR